MLNIFLLTHRFLGSLHFFFFVWSDCKIQVFFVHKSIDSVLCHLCSTIKSMQIKKNSVIIFFSSVIYS